MMRNILVNNEKRIVLFISKKLKQEDLIVAHACDGESCHDTDINGG